MNNSLGISIDDIPNINLYTSFGYIVVVTNDTKRSLSTFSITYLHWIHQNLFRLLCHDGLYAKDYYDKTPQEIFHESVSICRNKILDSDAKIIFDKGVTEKILKSRTDNESILVRKDEEIKGILTEDEYKDYLSMSEDVEKH